jgi:NitT/TauT family transport system substrate-binding protein
MIPGRENQSEREDSMWGRFLVAALACAVLMAGCGGEDESGGEASGGVTKVKVGVLPIANAAPLYVADEQGFFREEGIEIEPQLAQSGNELATALMAGESQFAFLGYVPVITARSKGLPLKIIANADNGAETAEDEWQVIMSAKGSDVREPADLAGKTLALNALKGVGEVAVKAALEAEGVDPDSVKLTEIPFPEMPAALEKGRVDAIWAPEPFLTQVLGQGGNEVLAPYISLAPLFPNGAYATSDKYLGESQEVVEGFARAINKGLEYATDNPDAARKTITTFTKIPPEVVDDIRLPLWPTEIDAAQVEDLIGYTQKYGVIEKTVPVDELIWEGATKKE